MEQMGMIFFLSDESFHRSHSQKPAAPPEQIHGLHFGFGEKSWCSPAISRFLQAPS